MLDLFFSHNVVLMKRVRKHLAHISEMTDQEVLRLALPVEEAMEGRLEREAVHDIELSPNDDTRRLLLRSLRAKFTREEAENFVLLTHEFGQHAHPQVPSVVDRELWSIHEHVLLATMPMHVNVRHDLVLVVLQVRLDISK